MESKTSLAGSELDDPYISKNISELFSGEIPQVISLYDDLIEIGEKDLSSKEKNSTWDLNCMRSH